MVVLFLNFASGRTLPTQSTGPQPIQLVPKHRFLQISLYWSLKSKKFKKQGGFIFQSQCHNIATRNHKDIDCQLGQGNRILFGKQTFCK